ncbi:MAG TPA: amidase [Ferruginibacter sp.]|nr:amidase [Ferruginibacter sp.]
MKRSDFLRNTTLAAAGIGTLLSTGCSGDNTADEKKVTPAASVDEFELNEITITELQQKMAAGKYTSERVTNLYLQRIAQIDKAGPTLNAVIELNQDAVATAIQMDAERKKGKIRSQLHGIPVLIKDNIDTAGKMKTTAGSLALENNIAAKDAFIITKLKEAGAVILGKTNLSEWANFRSGKSCSGWSSRGGQTKSPYVLDHNPCGSSSGSGVAVSANLCVVAIGTETDGSITCPASVNGCVGIKPTVGLVSRSGIIPISFTQDTAGPLARTVQDAAILLGLLTGIDTSDSKSKESEGRYLTDYTKFLNTGGLKGKRIGIEKKKHENQFLNLLLDHAKILMKEQGAEIIELDYLDKLNALGEAEFELLKFEFKDGLNKYLSQTNGNIRSLKDVIEFNKKNEDKVMPTFKQELLEQSEAKAGLDSKEYSSLLEKSHKGAQRIINETMYQNKLDALCGLTMGPACSTDFIYGDRWGDVFLTSPAAMSGYPHISVPCGFAYGLPVGLSFYSSAYREGDIIAAAYAFEQAGKHRQIPAFKTSLL